MYNQKWILIVRKKLIFFYGYIYMCVCVCVCVCDVLRLYVWVVFMYILVYAHMRVHFVFMIYLYHCICCLFYWIFECVSCKHVCICILCVSFVQAFIGLFVCLWASIICVLSVLIARDDDDDDVLGVCTCVHVEYFICVLRELFSLYVCVSCMCIMSCVCSLNFSYFVNSVAVEFCYSNKHLSIPLLPNMYTHTLKEIKK